MQYRASRQALAGQSDRGYQSNLGRDAYTMRQDGRSEEVSGSHLGASEINVDALFAFPCGDPVIGGNSE